MKSNDSVHNVFSMPLALFLERSASSKNLFILVIIFSSFFLSILFSWIEQKKIERGGQDNEEERKTDPQTYFTHEAYSLEVGSGTQTCVIASIFAKENMST